MRVITPVVSSSTIFSVNNTGKYLSPAENEKWFNVSEGGNGPSSCDFAWLSGEHEKVYYGPVATVASIIYEDKVPGCDCPGNKIFNSINWSASGA